MIIGYFLSLSIELMRPIDIKGSCTALIIFGIVHLAVFHLQPEPAQVSLMLQQFCDYFSLWSLVEIKTIKKVSLTPLPPDKNRNLEQFKLSRENCFTVELENRERLVVIAPERRIAQCWVRGLSLLAANKGKNFERCKKLSG